MFLTHTTVDARECVLRYRGGTLRDVLGPGRHRRVLGSRLVRVDLREQLLTLAAQEVLTTDGVSVKVTAVVRWSVADPVAFHEHSADPVGHVYLAAQVALRGALAALTAEQLLGRGPAVPGAEVTAATTGAAAQVGVAVAEVVVKDVILPAEVRAAAAELVTTRQRGLARLEAARAETAALRSLANGARLLDAHPALAMLRVVQSAPAGTQLVLRIEPAASGPTG